MADNDLPVDIGNLPVVLGPAGLAPQSPSALLSQLLGLVAKTNPGYTANLPGSLIEDISSTDVAAMVLIDQMRVEMLNSLTPRGCNAFVLNQLGQIYGVQVGASTNTSVYCVFYGLPGFVIGKGFVVTDGNYQYQVVDGGVVGSSGQSQPLFCVATQAGIWAVPAGTVTSLVTSVPQGFPLTVVNSEPGIPGSDVENITSYRARVLMAGLAASQGMARYLKTLVDNVPGVQPRLVSVQQQTGGGWAVIVGGGDPYEVAYAIWMALFDINNLVGSTLHVVTISQANPAVVTTDLNHLFTPGQPISIQGVLPTTYNGTSFGVLGLVGTTGKVFTLGVPFAANAVQSLAWATGVATATTLTNHGVTVGSTFTLVGQVPTGWAGTYTAVAGTTGTTLKWNLAANPGAATTLGQLAAGMANFDSTGLAAYSTGGVITPNLRNLVVTLTDYPDTFLVPFIIPPQQTLSIVVTWNTSSPNFVSPVAIAQLAGPALVDYINSVVVGQPLSQYTMEDVFADAVEPILPHALISHIVFQVSINGVGTVVSPGTGYFKGDPQSYFFARLSDITFTQG
jgi:hypothetical protein